MASQKCVWLIVALATVMAPAIARGGGGGAGGAATGGTSAAAGATGGTSAGAAATGGTASEFAPTGGLVPGAASTGGTATQFAPTGGLVPGAATTGGTAPGTAATTGGITQTTNLVSGPVPAPAGANVTTGLNPDGTIGLAGRVGTSLNGRPIGAPGSGLGSRENSAGSTAPSQP